MTDSLAAPGPDASPHRDLSAVVLAAGEGRRLRPLTALRPKALCPVGGVALVDLALARARAVTARVAVNAHHGRDQLLAHLAGDPGVVVSVEEDRALGTAGALGRLRPWLAGTGVLVLNADAWGHPDLAGFVAGWDGERVRVLVAGGDGRFGPRAQVAGSLLPWADVARLGEEPAGLYEACWRPAERAGRLEAVADPGPFVDCGTPARYLAANLQAAARHGGPSAVLVGAGASVTGSASDAVLGRGARVAGVARRAVLWEGVEVARGEELVGGIRADGSTTVLVR